MAALLTTLHAVKMTYYPRRPARRFGARSRIYYFILRCVLTFVATLLGICVCLFICDIDRVSSKYLTLDCPPFQVH